MAVESAVIVGLFGFIIFVFLRAKHKAWAAAVLPLLLVPLTDLAIELLLIAVLKIEVTVFQGILALVIALAGSAVWIGYFSGRLELKRYKASYIGITNMFNIILCAIIISDFLSSSSPDSTIRIIQRYA